MLLLLEKALEMFIVLLRIRLDRWSIYVGCFGSVLTKTAAWVVDAEVSDWVWSDSLECFLFLAEDLYLLCLDLQVASLGMAKVWNRFQRRCQISYLNWHRTASTSLDCFDLFKFVLEFTWWLLLLRRLLCFLLNLLRKFRLTTVDWSFGVVVTFEVAALLAVANQLTWFLLDKAAAARIFRSSTPWHTFFNDTVELANEAQGALVLLHLVIIVIESANLEVSCAVLLIGDDNTTCVLSTARCSYKYFFVLVV